MTAALTMRYDQSVDALYVAIGEGEIEETVEIEESVYVDVDATGRPLGIEFVSGADFLPFLVRHGGVFTIPERLKTAVPLELAPSG